MAVELSVLIATHERGEKLRRCLDALAAQAEPAANFEVVIADDGSSDGSTDGLENLGHPFALRVLKLPKGGKSAALNAAIEAAAGSVCLFIDDDVIASPTLVGAHLAAHRSDPRTVGIGVLTQAVAPGADAYAVAHARRWNERYAGLAGRPVDWADTYGGNVSAPRVDLLAIGGLDPTLSAIEDIELGHRLDARGCRFAFLPEGVAAHDDFKAGPRLLAEEVRYGTWCAKFVAAEPDTGRRLIGWIDQPSAHEVLLRRALLALRVAPSALVAAGRLVPGRGRREVWLDFVSRYAFWHGVRAGFSRRDWKEATRGVPVLMYHGFNSGTEGGRYVVARPALESQIRLLRLLRRRVVDIEEVAAALREHRPLPKRAVAITIDDGYGDVAEVALPALRHGGLPAIAYLVSDRIGSANDWDAPASPAEAATEVGGRPTMSAAEVEAIRAAGVRVGAHTRTHVKLPTVEPATAAAEIGGSRTELRARFGDEVESFAYPYGAIDETAVEAVRAAGFDSAVSTFPSHARRGDDPLLIPRIEVRGDEGTLTFLRKLLLGGA
jgi:glycosyltransferase involved in cell wall biosynthesis/peptidoglycan/xylan/chitin deacetylase (PgdA/CDA1 family)